MSIQSATLSEIKKELTHLPAKELLDICLALAKFKKENKELLNYLLFHSQNEDAFISEVKSELEAQFVAANLIHYYVAKKSLRKILKTITQYIKFSKNKKIELELLIHFCVLIKANQLLHMHPVIDNMYINQLKKINKALGYLHEDLQFDYKNAIADIEDV
jgi:hypothetical protein